jgi:hypothetical protein
MLKMVPLSKIKDNPYRDKKRNPVDQARVEQLVESIGTTGFWKGIYGREVEKFVEIAFGHTRVDAARKACVKEIPVEIEELTDSDMLMRMTRENLRGELLVSLEAVSAAVKAYGAGTVSFSTPDPKTNKNVLRYAPSYVPGKASVAPSATHPYTADVLARFLGGVYIRPDGHAQPSVLAALGILEMEERKVEGFSERTLRTVADEGDRYLGAKKIIQIVSDVKQREVKVIERREKTAEEMAAYDTKQRELAKARKEAEEKAESERKRLVEAKAAAIKADNVQRTKDIQARLDAKDAAEKLAAETFTEKNLALEVKMAEVKAAAVEAKKMDAYMPVKREVERILHRMEAVSSASALAEEVNALSRQPLNCNDRERLRQAAIATGTWYIDWVAMQFVPPFAASKKLNEYRSREASSRRAEEAKQEKAAARAVKKEKK